MNINNTFAKLDLNSSKTHKSSSKNSKSSHDIVNSSKSCQKIVYFKVVQCVSNSRYQLIRRDESEDSICGVFGYQSDILNACRRYAGESNDFVILNKKKYFERMPK